MWGFEGRDAYDRRVYFWNLLAAVLWQVSRDSRFSEAPFNISSVGLAALLTLNTLIASD